MSPSSKEMEQEELRQELRRQEQRKEKIQRQTAEQQRAIQRHQETLAQLARKETLPGRGDSLGFKLGLVLLLVGGLIAAGLAWRKLVSTPEKAGPAQQLMPEDLTPHLLITSTPSQATVLVDGRRAGTTPHLHAAPPRDRRYTVKVVKSGYLSQEKQMTVSANRGESWQVVLEAVPVHQSASQHLP